MMDTVAAWLATTSLSWAVRGGIPWLWPLCETLHFIGMSVLVGTVALLDLRLLGVAKGLPVGPIAALLPWGIGGFALNLVTGMMFFSGDPMQYSGNPAFRLKMLFILLAGANVVVFYAAGMRRRVEEIGPGQDAPLAARIVALTSLFLWVGVMYWGRMLPFIGDSF